MEAEEEKTQLKLSGDREGEEARLEVFGVFEGRIHNHTHSTRRRKQGTHSEQRLKFSRLGFGKGSSESKRDRREGREEDLGGPFALSDIAILSELVGSEMRWRGPTKSIGRRERMGGISRLCLGAME